MAMFSPWVMVPAASAARRPVKWICGLMVLDETL
jgi:hypothetical protein